MSTWKHPRFCFFAVSLPAGISVEISSPFLDHLPVGTGLLLCASKTASAASWTSHDTQDSPLRGSPPVPLPRAHTSAPVVCENLSHVRRLKSESGNEVGSSKWSSVWYNHFPQSPLVFLFIQPKTAIVLPAVQRCWWLLFAHLQSYRADPWLVRPCSV